ncbi:uncharacterized protein BX664DRAFT_353715 [Halteromyces radiatus]|uniref:uncharacterized protein n=1 Tax=Halteromyces radiatus TaxID=101107 RepID=UPI00221F1502|nr:uncharacterized protein BX664DRAFT_353715 [Halteromyces radiatus]KAI8077883.1 hypothetical protein BX664DRAFT_353715 [Halteromyces radiatus]
MASWMYYAGSRWHAFDPSSQLQLEKIWFSSGEGWVNASIGQAYYRALQNSLYCGGYYYDIRRLNSNDYGVAPSEL